MSCSLDHMQFSLVFGCAVIYMARLSVPLAAPQMTAEFSWDDVMLGYVLAFFFWGYAITQIPGGRLSDGIGGLRVMTAASLLGGLCLLLFPPLVARWPSSSIVFRLLLGLLQGVHFPAVSSVVSRHCPESRRVALLSLSCAGSPLGAVLSGTVGSLLLQRGGWRLWITCCGALCISFSLFLWWTSGQYRKGYQRVPPSEDGGGFKRLIDIDVSARKSDIEVTPSVPWKLLLRAPSVWACLWSHVAFCAVWHLLVSWLPTYFYRTFPEAQTWLVNTLPFAVNTCGTVLGPLLAAGLARRGVTTTNNRRVLEAVAHLSLMIALIALPGADSVTAAVLYLCAGALMAGLHTCAGFVLVQDMAPQHAGSLMGLVNTAGALSGFAGSLCAGYVVDSLGSYNAVFYINSALSASAALVFVMFASADRIV